MPLRNSEIFPFNNDLYAKLKKRRVQCDICGKYIKSTRIQLRKEKENKMNLKTFQFDEDIFAEPKKNRLNKIKCDMCGTYIEETQIHLHKLKHDLNCYRLLELRNIAKSSGIRYIKR